MFPRKQKQQKFRHKIARKTCLNLIAVYNILYPAMSFITVFGQILCLNFCCFCLSKILVIYQTQCTLPDSLTSPLRVRSISISSSGDMSSESLLLPHNVNRNSFSVVLALNNEVGVKNACTLGFDQFQ